jgi:hypothetical protein
VADQLASVPAKVVTLQSVVFENSERIKVLNLTLIRAEKAQRDGKGLALEETSDANHSSEPPKKGSRPLPPPDPKPQPLPKDRFGPPPNFSRGAYEEEEDFSNSRFHPRVRLEFPTFDGKEDPLPWLNCCETFFRG